MAFANLIYCLWL